MSRLRGARKAQFVGGDEKRGSGSGLFLGRTRCPPPQPTKPYSRRTNWCERLLTSYTITLAHTLKRLRSCMVPIVKVALGVSPKVFCTKKKKRWSTVLYLHYCLLFLRTRKIIIILGSRCAEGSMGPLSPAPLFLPVCLVPPPQCG